MDIFIEKLDVTDAEDLLNFEVENRIFFEEMVPTRGDEYYNLATFKKRHEALIEEQVIGSSYCYLIKDKDSLKILGRINIVDIDKKNGYLGYRVGQEYTGKGIASKALELLLAIVSDDEINQIKAKTTNNNIASQRVLEKNGFKKMCTSNEEVKLNGQSLSFVYYVLNISSSKLTGTLDE